MIDKIDDRKAVEQDFAAVICKSDKCTSVPRNPYFEHRNQLFFHDSTKREKQDWVFLRPK